MCIYTYELCTILYTSVYIYMCAYLLYNVRTFFLFLRWAGVTFYHILHAFTMSYIRFQISVLACRLFWLYVSICTRTPTFWTLCEHTYIRGDPPPSLKASSIYLPATWYSCWFKIFRVKMSSPSPDECNCDHLQTVESELIAAKRSRGLYEEGRGGWDFSNEWSGREGAALPWRHRCQ